MLRAMRSRLGFSILIAATGACNKSTPPEPRAPAPVAPAPAPAAGPAAGVIDQGVLHISARGKPAGEERFTLTGNDERRELVSKTTLRRGSTVAVEVEGTLVTDGRWRPEGGSFKHIASEGDKQKVSVHTLARQTTDAGPGGTLTLTVDQNPPIVEATPESPSDLYVNNLAVSHLGALCALARDDEREVKLFPGITLRLSGKRELEFATKAGAKKLNLVVFQAVGAEPVDVLCDGTRLVMVRQPSAQVVTTREGFEEIAEIIAEAEDRKPKIPAGLVELERSVTAPDGAPLACSFLAPADKRSPLPAVVLLGPAGGQDRDGDTTGHGGFKGSLLRHLAIALAQSGVASLRCDDRGVGDSASSQDEVVLPVLAGDASAMLVALRSEPGVDRERTGLVGHDEGATVAQLVAAGDTKVRALALLAPMGRTLDQVNLDRRAAEMQKLGIKDEVVRAERKRFAAIYAAIREGRTVPEDTPVETRAALAPMVLYLQSHFRYDPAYTARKIKVPVMLAHGGRDTEVPPSESKILQGLLAKGGNRKVKLTVYPELNHAFTPAKRGTTEDYTDPDLALDMAAIGDIVTFLRSSL